MNDELIRELLSIVAEAPGASLPRCGRDKGRVANVCCAECSGLFTWPQIYFEENNCILLCHSCKDQLLRKEKRNRFLNLLKKPFFYILLSISLALILYVLGQGRTSISLLEKRDEGQPPFQQKLGYLYLNRADRAAERVQLLESLGPVEEIPKWARLAASSFTLANDYWNDDRVAPDLQVAAAVMTAKAGHPNSAYEQLEKLDGSIPAKSLLSYRYYCGDIALRSLDLRTCQSDWEKVLESTLNRKVDLINFVTEKMDEALAAYKFEMDEATWTSRVRESCEMDLPEGLIYKRILEGFRDHHIHSEVANRFMETFPSVLNLFHDTADKKQPLVERLEN